ncbi:hypothetical protein LY78DRAFT_217890 [Colletotrichum sublineola]|nr:hypothetical protein LY78DRAFT_217890 [Colletotrichum sublineola]
MRLALHCSACLSLDFFSPAPPQSHHNGLAYLPTAALAALAALSRELSSCRRGWLFDIARPYCPNPHPRTH